MFLTFLFLCQGTHNQMLGFRGRLLLPQGLLYRTVRGSSHVLRYSGLQLFGVAPPPVIVPSLLAFPPLLLLFPDPPFGIVNSPFMSKRLYFSYIPVKFFWALSIPQDACRLKSFQYYSAMFCKALRLVWVPLRSMTRNTYDAVCRFSVEAPIIAFFSAGANCWNNMDTVHLPICRKPMFFVVHKNLYCKRHVVVNRKIRRQNRSILL